MTSRAEDTPWRGQTPGCDVDLSPILRGKNRLRGSSAVLFYNTVLVIARHERSEPLRLIELATSEGKNIPFSLHLVSQTRSSVELTAVNLVSSIMRPLWSVRLWYTQPDETIFDDFVQEWAVPCSR